MPDDGFVQFNKHIIEYMRGVYLSLIHIYAADELDGVDVGGGRIS